MPVEASAVCVNGGKLWQSDQSKIVNIAMSADNSKHFINVIDKAKEDYIALVETRQKELV